MKGSLTVIALFVLGCLLGWLHLLPDFFHTKYSIAICSLSAHVSRGTQHWQRQQAKGNPA